MALTRALRDRAQLVDLELGPLDRQGTAELAGQMHGAPLDSVASEQIYQATAGNPLYIVELARAGLVGKWSGIGPSDLVISPALFCVKWRPSRPPRAVCRMPRTLTNAPKPP